MKNMQIGSTARAYYGRLVYFVLAALVIATVSASLWLHHRTTETYAESLATNRGWSEVQGRLADLGPAVAEVAGPAHELFNSLDPDWESERRDDYRRAFEARVSSLRDLIAMNLKASDAGPLSAALDDLDRTVGVIVEEQDVIFRQFRAGLQSHGGRGMSAMEEHYGLALGTLVQAGQYLRDLRQTNSQSQLAAAEAHERVLRWFGGLVALVVLAITIFGGYPTRLMRAAAAERQTHLAAVRQNEATLQRQVRELSESEQRLESQGRALEDLAASLAKARDEAEAANRAKTDFLATMSHEIRTPMNGVLGMTELLISTGLEEEQQQFAETIRLSGETLIGIINEILDYSKIGSGKLDLEASEFDPSELVDGVLDLMMAVAREKEIELACYLPADLPANLIGDSGRLRQVLINLVGNGIKFTEEGGVTIEASVVQTAERDVELRFQVSDTGIGVAPELHDHLFDVFAQADASTTRKFGGTGLGLAICKRIVVLMDGEIGIESAPGEGSVFWFTARFARAEAAGGVANPLPVPCLRGRRALIVEDNMVSQQVLRRFLEELDLLVTVADDGEAALEALKQAQASGGGFDFVVSDEAMPRMDGPTLLSRLRAEPRFQKLRFVLSTASGRIGSRKQALAQGFDGWLPKPVRRRDVAEALVKAESEPSSFDCLSDAPPAAVASDRPVEDRIHGAPTGGLKVLLSEDNMINQNVAMAILSKAGHRVDIANDGREALAAVAREDYDVVLMDMQMPVLDGLEATREIRALEGEKARTPIIAMTANAMPGDKERCLSAGMNDYVAKPIDTATLLRKLAFWGGVGEASSATDLPGEDTRTAVPDPAKRQEIDPAAKRAFDDLVAAIE